MRQLTILLTILYPPFIHLALVGEQQQVALAALLLLSAVQILAIWLGKESAPFALLLNIGILLFALFSLVRDNPNLPGQNWWWHVCPFREAGR